MDDLVRWLGACLDEDERIARDAGGPIGSDHHWFEVSTTKYPGVVGTQRGLLVTTDRTLREHAVHIAEWDPARVLRDLDARRGIVARYAFACREAADLNISEEERETRVQVAAAFQSCFLLLAKVYKDRPGYAEAVASTK